MAKPVGIRGSWFANWRGEEVPCVHKHWTKMQSGRMSYLDPGVSSDPKWPPFIEAIKRTKKVILTDDAVDEGGIPGFKRTGYIGLYRVENVDVKDQELSFDYIERLDNFT